MSKDNTAAQVRTATAKQAVQQMRALCLSEAVRSNIGPNHFRILQGAKAFETYILTGKTPIERAK